MIRIGAILLLALPVVGCGAMSRIQPPSTPAACGDVFSAERCELIVDTVAVRMEVDRGQVLDIVIVPEPTPQIVDDGTILTTRSGGPLLIVAATLEDGTTETLTMCGGVASEPVCVDDPRLRAMSITADGYRDVPCCDATAPPTAEPGAVAASRPLHIERIDIPIDRTGTYEVPIGRGSLPNGILTDASFATAEAWPADVRIPSGWIFLDVRSLEPDGEPFDNHYLHDWRPGVERFEAVLVFEVSWFEPGAVLAIEDVVVR